MTTEAETGMLQLEAQGTRLLLDHQRPGGGKEGWSPPGFRGGRALLAARFWAIVSRTVRDYSPKWRINFYCLKPPSLWSFLPKETNPDGISAFPTFSDLPFVHLPCGRIKSFACIRPPDILEGGGNVLPSLYPGTQWRLIHVHCVRPRRTD